MNLTPSTTQSGRRSITLLAPSMRAIPNSFEHVDFNPERHEVLLSQMQRLRGAVYLKDGAIQSDQLTTDGRHKLPVDERSWHVLTFDENDKVSGCSRYCVYPEDVQFDQLDLVGSALATDVRWKDALRSAIEADIALARRLKMSFAEAGGWALSEALRGTTEALRIALATYSLASLLGGSIGMSTATVRNCSCSILRRLGGHSLQFRGMTFPRYFDTHYQCEMELLRFDSRYPQPRFREWVQRLGLTLTQVPIVCASLGWESAVTQTRRFSVGSVPRSNALSTVA
jgi:hypothetical protein